MTKTVQYLTAGALATIPMTAAMMYLFKKLPPHEKIPLPPRNITMKLADKAGVKDSLKEEEKTGLTLLNHFSFGAVTGAFYYPLSEKIKAPGLLTGMSYGLLVWGVSYLGLLPASGLYPSAVKMPKERNALMIAAHLIWGGSLGLMKSALTTRKALPENYQ